MSTLPADLGPATAPDASSGSDAVPDHPLPTLGLVVNPIAGLGGSVGLKGTDGPDTVARALAMGAVPRATERAAAALRGLARAWTSDRTEGHPPALLTGHGMLGDDAARLAGYPATVIGDLTDIPTTASDTRRLVAQMFGAGVDLLLFAGGDGTARDVASVDVGQTTVLGIPAGVKIQSGVFATSPIAAGILAAEHLTSRSRSTSEREVVDLDEDALRRGTVAPRLFGSLWVPEGRRVQPRKSPAPADEAGARAGIAAAVVARIGLGDRYILGPGTTVHAIGEWLGITTTLVGVDVVMGTSGGARLLVADAGEADLLGSLVDGRTWIVVTPIGSQGFIFGRGNQPISARVLRSVERERVIVVATPGKLASLGGRPLLVDTGDPAVDRDLSGYLRVLTGPGEAAIVPVEAA